MSLIATALVNDAITEALLHSAREALSPARSLIGQTPDFEAQARSKSASPYRLPAVDALIAGTIGAGLNAHADRIEESAGKPMDMGRMLAGNDFTPPAFVMAMQDMGSGGGSFFASFGMNSNFNTPGTLLSA